MAGTIGWLGVGIYRYKNKKIRLTIGGAHSKSSAVAMMGGLQSVPCLSLSQELTARLENQSRTSWKIRLGRGSQSCECGGARSWRLRYVKSEESEGIGDPYLS